MAVNGFHHIALATKDMEKSLAFYVQGLGSTVVHSFPMGDSGKTIYLVDMGNNAVLEIIPRDLEGAEANGRFFHICLTSTDVQADFDKAVAAGATVRTAPKESMLGTMKVCNAFVIGPDDEVIEYLQQL